MGTCGYIPSYSTGQWLKPRNITAAWEKLTVSKKGKGVGGGERVKKERKKKKLNDLKSASKYSEDGIQVLVQPASSRILRSFPYKGP